ncbi:MAG TPA: hypothetical protein PLO37_09175 [Candidatus Hydrogenedentes bacterium]|nr:hypothetical protein [Candidatus Hydrogenedentota bacterium]
MEEMDRWHRNEGKTAPPKKRMGPPDGNLNPMKHGIFANKCLNAEERASFDELIERLYQDFEFNKSSDFLQLELVAIYSVKRMRAQVEGNVDAAQKLDPMIRAHMKDLKATKIAREGDQLRGLQTTPADWATELLEKTGAKPNAKAAKTDRPRKNAKKMSDNSGPPDPEDPVNRGDPEDDDA